MSAPLKIHSYDRSTLAGVWPRRLLVACAQALGLSCVLAASLMGCAAKPVTETFVRASAPPAGYALVYFVRVPNFSLQSGLVPSLTLNELPLVDITNEGYTWLHLKPGSYVLKTIGTGMARKDFAFDLSFDVAEGKTYLVQLELPVVSSAPTSYTQIVTGTGVYLSPNSPTYVRGWRVYKDDDVEWRLDSLKTREFLRPARREYPPSGRLAD